MPTQLGPGEDIRGAPVSPSNPEHFPNRNQEPKSARTRLSQGGCTSGLARKRVGTCETMGSRVSAAGGGPPALAASQAERCVRPAGTGAVRQQGKAGRGRGGRSRPRRRKQPPPQLRECGRGLPAGGGEKESFDRFHPARSRRLGPARPRPGHRLSPSRRGGREVRGREGPATAPLRGVATCSAPTCLLRACKGRSAGGGAGAGGGARRALVRWCAGAVAGRQTVCFQNGGSDGCGYPERHQQRRGQEAL